MKSSGHLQAAMVVIFLFVYSGSETGLIAGGYSAGKWTSWKTTRRSVKGNEAYALYSPTGESGPLTAGKPTLSPASGSAYNVTLSKTAPAGSHLVAISGAKWNPQPRKPMPQRDRSAIPQATIGQALMQMGIRKPRYDIKKVWMIDLDGDGKQEMLIEAASPGLDTSGDPVGKSKRGDFSAVYLRQVVGVRERVTLLGGEFLPKAPKSGEAVYNSFRLNNVLDLNGDGKLEVIVETSYSEGGGVLIWDISNAKPKKVLEAVDGA